MLSPKCLNSRNRWATSKILDVYELLLKKYKFLFVELFLSFFKTEQLKENQKQSKEKVSCTVKRIQDLEVSTKELRTPFVFDITVWFYLSK